MAGQRIGGGKHLAKPGAAEREPGSGDAGPLPHYESALRTFFSRRLSSRQEIDDLVQETFARLLTSREHRDVQFPVAYLFRIASNLLTDHRRRETRRRGDVEIDGDDQRLAVAPEQEDRRHLADLQRRLDCALALLPGRCREVFVMRRFRNMTTPEIADALGISHRMVQKHMTRAMLHVYLSLRGSGSEDAS